MSSKGKYSAEFVAQFKTRASGEVGTKKELYNFFKEPKLSITIRIARLRLAGHVRRMDKEALPRKVMYVTPIGQRKTGRPNHVGGRKLERM
jgi:hypothetical protein